MQKNIISRTIKNISIILLMFVAVLFLLFWSIFFDFKENAFINAKTNYELNIDKYTNIEDIEFQQSKNENFLQLADICAYNIRRQFMEH